MACQGVSSGSGSLGSNPSPAAHKKTPLRRGFCCSAAPLVPGNDVEGSNKGAWAKGGTPPGQIDDERTRAHYEQGWSWSAAGDFGGVMPAVDRHSRAVSATA